MTEISHDKRIDVPKKLSGSQVQFFIENGYIAVPNLIESDEIEELREDTKGVEGYRERMDALDPQEARSIEDAGILQRLLNKHTGRLEDVRGLVGEYDDSESLKDSIISSSEYRR